MIRLLSLTLLSLISTSCVYVYRDQIPENWPKIDKNAQLSDFAGQYEAKPASSTEQTYKHRENLSYFLTGKTDPSDTMVKLSQDGNGLQSGSFSSKKTPGRDGALFVRKNRYSEYDALATVHISNKHYLYKAEDGSLIGLRTGHGSGRVLFFPAVGTGRDWILWKKSR